MNTKSIRFEIAVSIIAVVILSMFVTGIGWYFSEVNLKKDDVVGKAMIALQPIVSLAARSIDGGNVMNLKNTNGQDLYKANADLLFLQMYGVSAGTPATDFSDEIPPTAIDYNYTKEGFSENIMLRLINASNVGKVEGVDYVLFKEENVLVVQRKLDIQGGGVVNAVFSAEALEDVWRAVLKKISFVFVIVLIGSVMVALFVGNRMTKAIIETAQQVTSIAKTLDLTSKVRVSVKNEIGDLAHWFNSFIDRLQSMMSVVSNLTNQTNYSATEISAAVTEQSIIATQQSTSVSEIASTLEELSITSSQIFENSHSVVEISATALRQSESGMEAIGVIKEKMDQIAEDNKESTREIIELGKTSKEIGRVMDIINGIADQTKLIAFNAAIEAASAGEAGKRFGVVAVEIRRLADNVMSSTGEIAQRIEKIQQGINGLVIASEKGAKRIQEGELLARQTLAGLENMVAGAKSTNDAADQISHSTRQQKTAMEQVLLALKEIEKGIRQSSTSIRQTTTITNGLTDSSERLKKLVDEFKIN